MVDHSRKVSKTSALRREIRRKYHEVGAGGILRIGLYKLIREICKIVSFKKQNPDPFDLKYGTDTSGIIKPGALDIPDGKVSHAVQYQTAIVKVFLDILNSLPIYYEQFIFIDLGSGKGRALLLASRYPFKEIIGVELSEQLNHIARRNIAIYSDEMQKCHKISSVWEDVGNYSIPQENTVFYLFNPFDEQVIKSVLANIEKLIHNCSKEIYIAYLKPVYRNVFDRATFLKIVNETERFVIYKNTLRTFS